MKTLINGRIAFLRGFLKHPRQVGSVIPSSRFLERRLVELGGVSTAKTIVELGPGTGGTTRAILRAMPKDARLLSIEIIPEFYGFLRRIDDPRLIAHLGSAEDLREVISSCGLPAAQAVICGIPLSIMGPSHASRILDAILAVLAPGGRFVVYQIRDQVDRLCRPYLGPARVEVEFLNIPPLRVFQWNKQAVQPEIS